MQYIDMHCDTLMRAYVDKRETVYQIPEFMLDISRLKKGNCLAQFFAIFMLPESMRGELGEAFIEDEAYVKALTKIFRQSMEAHPELIAPAGNLLQLEQNQAAGRMSGILSLEDGRVVNGRLENLDWLYEEGVRMIALTWNYENCFGFPNSGDASVMGKGLKKFGLEAVERMNELGMLIDVSHLNDGGFWDVAGTTKAPFVASHSNCRALAPHQRNLTDDMIRALGEKGGVMGLNFCGPFLNGDARGRESRIEVMLDHLQHMINVGGSDIAAIGTDFDGTWGDFDIDSCEKMPLLFEAMERRGFSGELIEKIAYRNVERVMRQL